ncbi:hypothetical protein M885DRAFT_571269 [Pelagophyceae sp. CCMP2097]|nr:hypothetical protein M885DRAFT_571269 [Pelagophyceae sp. CCMP2097]|mmetsp:Transcript_28081/g.94574  ORF Transcript_28081/g.94574 Transcript_28081/m.94574 type:complete len:252 (+) Transcript_28081:54-809(+)
MPLTARLLAGFALFNTCGGLQTQKAPSPARSAVRRQLFGVAGADLQVGAGVAGLLGVAANRFVLSGELPPGLQSRADLVAVAALCGVILEGLGARDITSRESEVFTLKGINARGVSKDLSAAQAKLYTWAADSIISSQESARVVFVWRGGATLLRQGILGDSPAVDAESLTFKLAIEKGHDGNLAHTYIPDLQAVPARVEFLYLPKNTQCVLIQPLGPQDALIVGCDRKRALSPRNIGWIRQVALRLLQPP